jgi:hypothetical protein
MPALALEECDPLVDRIDVAIRRCEVGDMMLEPIGHERLDEGLVLGLLLGRGVCDMMRRECV